MHRGGHKRGNEETRVPDCSVFAPPEKRLKPTTFASTNIIERLSDENDGNRLSQRQKQIDFGKNTLAYERYAREVPRHYRGNEAPWTPDIADPISKRRFDGKVKQWRRDLHEWENDHPGEAAEPADRATERLSEKSASSSVIAGLSGCATSFDDFLSGHLEEDEEEEEEEEEGKPVGIPVGSSAFAPSATPSPPAVPPSEVPAAVVPPSAVAEESAGAASGGSLRSRLNQFKGSKTAQGGSIFAAFDDAGLV